MELKTVRIEKPDEVNLILGQAHFIKTVEDVYEALTGVSATCASGSRSASRRDRGWCARRERPRARRARHAQRAGDRGRPLVHRLPARGYPVNVLNQLKQVPEVCRIYCATANPVEVLVAETQQGRGSSAWSTVSPRSASKATRTSPSAATAARIGYKL